MRARPGPEGPPGENPPVRGGARAGARGRVSLQGLRPGPHRRTRLLTHPRLPSEPDEPDQRDEGTLGPERPREDPLGGREGGGPEAAVEGKIKRRREGAEMQVRAALGGLQSTQPHPSTKGDFRKLPRPFVPRRRRSSDRLGRCSENYTCAVLKS